MDGFGVYQALVPRLSSEIQSIPFCECEELDMHLPFDWPMSRRLVPLFCAVGFLLPAARVVYAQKIAGYDYTDAKPSERIRPPLPAPPPTLLPDGTPAVGGVCGGILANPPLAVTLLSFDRDSYVFGDEFTFIMRVEALRPTRVQVSTSMAEIEPSDPKVSYEWRPMGVSLELRSPNHYTVGMGLVHLYGSKESPASEVELKTGEWVELHGKARMEWTNSLPGSFPDRKKKWILPLPLKHPQQFSASAYIMRGEGYRFDATTRQETRVCHPAEHSSSYPPVSLTVVPTRTRAILSPLGSFDAETNPFPLGPHLSSQDLPMGTGHLARQCTKM